MQDKTLPVKDVVHEARLYITRLRSDRAFDGECTNSYDISLLGSLCSEIERLRADLAHAVDRIKRAGEHMDAHGCGCTDLDTELTR